MKTLISLTSKKNCGQKWTKGFLKVANSTNVEKILCEPVFNNRSLVEPKKYKYQCSNWKLRFYTELGLRQK